MNAKEDNVDEREEGEIIDEFEDIISSDEEFSMRKRIEELEAKNAELEKIANISVSGAYGSEGYNDYPKKDSHHLDRYPLVSIDISDEDEEYPPAPKMPRISKRRKSASHHKLLHTSTGSSNHRRRKRSSSPPPAPSYRPSDKLLLSLFHEKIAASQNNSYPSRRKRKTKKAHSSKSSSSLRRKSRDYFVNDTNDDYNNFDSSYHTNIDQNSHEHLENSDCDRSFSLNRDELRVALARNTIRIEQHAPLKDRLSRRKENTDMYNFVQSLEDSPSSPPLQDEVVVVEEDKTEDKQESDDSLEEQELRILALKSAMLKKHMVRKKRNENVAYSPSDFDEIYKCTSESPPLNNIDDQETCNSMEISPVPSPKLVLSDDGRAGIDTKPVDMDIVNSDSECELPAYDEWIPIEQIPLPNNCDFSEEIYNPTPVRFAANNLMPPEVRYDSPKDSEVDEEELALRALLLAKMNSPKVNKMVKKQDPQPVPPPMVPPPPTTTEIVVKVQTPDPDVSLEAETLRNFLIANMQKKKDKTNNSTASVLKEAVRRLTGRNASASPMDNINTEKDLNQAIKDMANIEIEETAKIRVKSPETLNASTKIESGEASFKTESCQNNEVQAVLQVANLAEQTSEELSSQNNNKINPGMLLKPESPGEHHASPKTEVGQASSKNEICQNNKVQTNLQVESLPEQTSEELSSQMNEKISPEMLLKPERPAEGVQIKSEIVSDVPQESQRIETDELACNLKENSKTFVEKIQNLNSIEENSQKAIPKDTENVEIGVSKVSILEEQGADTNKSDVDQQVADQILVQREQEDVTQDLESSSKEISIKNEPKQDEEITFAEKAIQEVAPSSNIIHENSNKDEMLEDLNSKQSLVVESTIPKETVLLPLEDIASQTAINDTELKPTDKVVEETLEDLNSSIEEAPKRLKVDPTLEKAPRPLQEKRQVKLGPKSLRVQIQQKKSPSKAPQLPKTQVQKPPTKTTTPQKVAVAQKPLPIAPRTKIVKPNKVINQPAGELKRKTTDPQSTQLAQPVPPKKPKLDETNNRLVTSAEIPQHPELIIQLRASESESEYSDLAPNEFEEDEDDEDARVRNFFNRNITIGNEYYDIASPISLPMESPCDTPIPHGSPIVSRTQTPQPPPSSVEKSIVNDYFEAKLEQFLKNVRSKVTDTTKKPTVLFKEQENAAVAAVNSTPVAVRHLPEASQQEYRRLINRMKMLERQKQAKNLQVSVKSSEAGATASITDCSNKFLVRKVLVKNATAKPSPSKTVIPKESSSSSSSSSPLKTPDAPVKSPSSPGSPQNSKSKENLLVLYENSYRKTGASIISSLDKSLEMVMVAKKAKMAKLKHEQRLKELRKEMEEVQKNLKEQQEKITKIYPEIFNSHRAIESLKTRRTKIHKAVTTLGKSVIGPNYSMQNDQKPIIMEKSKKLAAEIKLVNTMKLSDLELMKDESKSLTPNKVTPAQKDLETSISEKLPNKSLPADAETPSQNKAASLSIETFNTTESTNDEQIPAQRANGKSSPTPLSPKTLPNDLPLCDENQSPLKSQSEEEDNMENDASDKKIVPEALYSCKDEEKPAPSPANDQEEAFELEQPVVVVVVGSSDNDNANDNNEHNEQSPDQTTIIMEANVDEEENGDNLVGSAKLQDYVSPLSHLREERHINPNGVVCPYQLMGQCDDKDCKYMHLDD